MPDDVLVTDVASLIVAVKKPSQFLSNVINYTTIVFSDSMYLFSIQ